jgi:hypothetical protein
MLFRKDRVQMLAIYKANPLTSREEYRKRFDALADELVPLPVVKRNLLRYELVRPSW